MANQIKFETSGLEEALFLVTQLENDIRSTQNGVSAVIRCMDDMRFGSKDELEDRLNRITMDMEKQREALDKMKSVFQIAMARSDDYNSDITKGVEGIITALTASSSYYPVSRNGAVQALSGVRDWMSSQEGRD